MLVERDRCVLQEVVETELTEGECGLKHDSKWLMLFLSCWMCTYASVCWQFTPTFYTVSQRWPKVSYCGFRYRLTSALPNDDVWWCRADVRCEGLLSVLVSNENERKQMCLKRELKCTVPIVTDWRSVIDSVSGSLNITPGYLSVWRMHTYPEKPQSPQCLPLCDTQRYRPPSPLLVKETCRGVDCGKRMCEFKLQKPWRNSLFINILGRKCFSLSRSPLTILLEFQLLQGELLTWPARPFTVWKNLALPGFWFSSTKKHGSDRNAPLELCFESLFLWKHRGAQSPTELVKKQTKKGRCFISSLPLFLSQWLTQHIKRCSSHTDLQSCTSLPLNISKPHGLKTKRSKHTEQRGLTEQTWPGTCRAVVSCVWRGFMCVWLSFPGGADSNFQTRS